MLHIREVGERESQLVSFPSHPSLGALHDTPLPWTDTRAYNLDSLQKPLITINRDDVHKVPVKDQGVDQEATTLMSQVVYTEKLSPTFSIFFFLYSCISMYAHPLLYAIPTKIYFMHIFSFSIL